MSILKTNGWLVSRSAASHGAVDIFAAKDGRMLLVQVKSGRARLKKGEIDELIRWGKNSNGDAEVWHFKRGGKLEKKSVYMANGRDAQ